MRKRWQWVALSGAASLVAVAVTRAATRRVWRQALDEDPARRAGSGQLSGATVAWAAVSAGTAALARIAATRGAHALWVRVVGSSPPNAA